jgi:hypothetical protein
VRVILVGAGASYGSLGPSAPLSATFGAQLTATSPAWEARWPFLAAAVDHLGSREAGIVRSSWALDRVWNGIDESLKLTPLMASSSFVWPSRLGSAHRLYGFYADRTWSNFWVVAGWELRRALTTVLGPSLSPAIDVYLAGGQRTLGALISSLEWTDIIVTTNYDPFVERLIASSPRWPLGGWQLSHCDRPARSDPRARADASQAAWLAELGLRNPRSR